MISLKDVMVMHSMTAEPRYPLLLIRNRRTGTEHLVGMDGHDSLVIQNDGSIRYENLQTGESSDREDGDYDFVADDFDDYGQVIRFVNFETLQALASSMHKEQVERTTAALENLAARARDMFSDEE